MTNVVVAPVPERTTVGLTGRGAVVNTGFGTMLLLVEEAVSRARSLLLRCGGRPALPDPELLDACAPLLARFTRLALSCGDKAR